MFLKMVIIFNIEILYFDTTAVLYLKLFMDTLFCQLHEGGREDVCNVHVSMCRALSAMWAMSACAMSACAKEKGRIHFDFSQNLRIPAVKPVQKCMSNHVHVHLQQTFVAEIFSILQHNARKRLRSDSFQYVQSSLPWRWPCKFDIFASKSWSNHREDGTYHQRIGDAQGSEENWQVFTRVCTNCFP